MKILICTPCAQGNVRQEYCHSLLTQTFNATPRLMNQEKYQVGLYQLKNNSGLSKDRGILASYGLRNGWDKIFFIDADMEWTWEQFKAIADSEHDIVAGIAQMKVYPARYNFTPLPEDKDVFEPEKGIPTPLGVYRWDRKTNAPEKKVGAIGTAFMCVTAKVFAELTQVVEPFRYRENDSGNVVACWDFFPTGVVNGTYIGEDFSFCINARKKGFSVYANTDVVVNHIGDHVYNGKYSLEALNL